MTFANALEAGTFPNKEQMTIDLSATAASKKPQRKPIEVAVYDPTQYSIMLAQRKREKERHELLALIGINEMKVRMGAEAFLGAIARP